MQASLSREYWNKKIGPHAAYDLGVSLLGGELDSQVMAVMGVPPTGYMAWKAANSTPFKVPMAGNDDMPARAGNTGPKPVHFQVAAAETSSRSFSLAALVRSLADFVSWVAFEASRPLPTPTPARPLHRPFLASVDGVLTPAGRARRFDLA